MQQPVILSQPHFVAELEKKPPEDPARHFNGMYGMIATYLGRITKKSRNSGIIKKIRRAPARMADLQ